MSHLSYDDVRESIRDLSAFTDSHRRVHWFNSVLGVSRGDHNRIEIFLPGEPLEARLPIVSSVITHGAWSRSGHDGPFYAVRLLLPPGEHYDAMAATICVELSRTEILVERQRAFSCCEPLIELALMQADLAQEVVIGLFGELYLLLFWLMACEADTPELIKVWRGYATSVRDFVSGNIGVEVKTTLGSTSSHLVSGVHQVEPTPSDERPSEEVLLLVSIGLTPMDQGENVLSLISKIDALLRSTDAAAANAFQVHVSDYGGQSTGYRYGNENHPALLRQAYGIAFTRAYDMSDPIIQVLRLADLQAHPHVQTDSVSFRINLPTYVSGDVNPVVGIAQVVDRLTRAG